jgi:hypothetical protein
VTHHQETEDTTEDKCEVYNVAHHKTDLLLAKEGVEPDYKVMNGALTYSHYDWPATQLPSPMCHMAYVYEYRFIEHSVLIYKEVCSP